MVRLTERDERVIEWLRVVRIADMEAVRRVLGAYSDRVSEGDAGEPVSLRFAQQRVAKLVEAGVLGRGRPTFREGSVVWATRAYTGRDAPSLFRQTLRHDVAVARVSSEYIARGFEWREDRIARSKSEHQADGVATFDGEHVELVEVELTPKTTKGRYRVIMQNHDYRLAGEGVSYVRYYCDAVTAARVEREVQLHAPRRSPFGDGAIDVLTTFDRTGRWIVEDAA